VSAAEKRRSQSRKIARQIEVWDEAARYAIQTTRRKQGVSQEALANRMGWSIDIVSNVEKGRRFITVAEFIVLAEKIGISPETLLKRVEKWKSSGVLNLTEE
jgi:transcriptional regulator with XRE-family HTH domain